MKKFTLRRQPTNSTETAPNRRSRRTAGTAVAVALGGSLALAACTTGGNDTPGPRISTAETPVDAAHGVLLPVAIAEGTKLGDVAKSADVEPFTTKLDSKTVACYALRLATGNKTYKAVVAFSPTDGGNVTATNIVGLQTDASAPTKGTPASHSVVRLVDYGNGQKLFGGQSTDRTKNAGDIITTTFSDLPDPELVTETRETATTIAQRVVATVETIAGRPQDVMPASPPVGCIDPMPRG